MIDKEYKNENLTTINEIDIDNSDGIKMNGIKGYG